MTQITNYLSNHRIVVALIYIVVCWLLLQMIESVYRHAHRKKPANIKDSFFKGVLEAFLVILTFIRVISLSSELENVTQTLLMSSSLIVVVLGFIFQEGLSNIVHGFILSIFKPFQIGDRVMITIDGEGITGYIESIDLRSTIIKNVVNSSHVIVPNSKMDMCVIDNSYFDSNSVSSNFLDISITYESNLEKAIAVVSQVIAAHPYVQTARKEKNITEPVTVLVRDLGDSGIYLRASVMTKTVEENFAACSDIRRNLVACFNQEPDLEFAYPHVQIVKE